MVLPPGPTTCPLACTTSCAKERRVPNPAPPPERRADTSLIRWLSRSLLHIYFKRLDVWEQVFVGLNMNWMRPWCLVLDDLDMKRHDLTSVPPRKKGTGDERERPLFTSSLQPTQKLAFFSFTLLLFLFCLFCWPLPYWEGNCQLAGRMHRLT